MPSSFVRRAAVTVILKSGWTADARGTKTFLRNICVVWASAQAWVRVPSSNKSLRLGLLSPEWVAQSILVLVILGEKLSRALVSSYCRMDFFIYPLNVKHFCKAEKLLSPNQRKQQDKFLLQSSVRGLPQKEMHKLPPLLFWTKRNTAAFYYSSELQIPQSYPAFPKCWKTYLPPTRAGWPLPSSQPAPVLHRNLLCMKNKA